MKTHILPTSLLIIGFASMAVAQDPPIISDPSKASVVWDETDATTEQFQCAFDDLPTFICGGTGPGTFSTPVLTTLLDGSHIVIVNACKAATGCVSADNPLLFTIQRPNGGGTPPAAPTNLLIATPAAVARPVKVQTPRTPAKPTPGARPVVRIEIAFMNRDVAMICMQKIMGVNECHLASWWTDHIPSTIQ